jgi:hypothetical protein
MAFQRTCGAGHQILADDPRRVRDLASVCQQDAQEQVQGAAQKADPVGAVPITLLVQHRSSYSGALPLGGHAPSR